MGEKFKYDKREKLKSKKDIDLLFTSGKSSHSYPLRVMFLDKSEKTGTLINAGVTVPKKNIKTAVSRNLIKRRIREAYRLHNKDLKKSLTQSEREINLMIIYTSKQILPYKEIEDKIKVLLTRLTELSEVGIE
jgi:ribonuclease P protein component